MARSMALLGSGEFEDWATEPVDRWLLESSTSGTDRVLILPTASAPEGQEVFDGWGTMGLAHYRRLGASPEVLPLATREDAFRPEIVDALAGAAVVFFSGGNPAYLCRVLEDTPFWEALRTAMEGGLSMGGCSAGACILGALAPDSSIQELVPEIWTPGLSYLPTAVFGPHWDALDSFAPGLREFIMAAVPPTVTLVGIDERTAIVGDGVQFTVRGVGGVLVRGPGRAGTVFSEGQSFSLDRTN